MNEEIGFMLDFINENDVCMCCSKYPYCPGVITYEKDFKIYPPCVYGYDCFDEEKVKQYYDKVMKGEDE